jgi:hypothetical protein
VENSYVFEDVNASNGWIPEATFMNALKRLYPKYKSSMWWMGKLHRTVDIYPDVIEKQRDEHSPQKWYLRLKRRESESPVLSPQPPPETKASENASPPQPLIGIAALPGITIRDRVVRAGQYAELIGALSVEEKTGTRRKIAEAEVVGYWKIAGRVQKNIHGKTDKEGRFATAMRVDTDISETCTLVITTIAKAGYTSPSMPVTGRWNGFPPSVAPPPDGQSLPPERPPESKLRERYGYSVEKNVSVADRHRALQCAVENPDGLGLAYVVRWLTHFNGYVENNKRHTDAIEHRKDDLRWLKTTYYDPLKVKHFHFPPL